MNAIQDPCGLVLSISGSISVYILDENQIRIQDALPLGTTGMFPRFSLKPTQILTKLFPNP